MFMRTYIHNLSKHYHDTIYSSLIPGTPNELSIKAKSCGYE